MAKAYDVMTRALATCTPDTPVRQIAAQMRDLNIGDVLVVQDGKLAGIVTDRDLAIHALAEDGNTSETPVEKYMTRDVVTGQPHWSLEQIAQVMGKHQIRRLPIVQNDQVVGIVSLGDVALHSSKKNDVGESLRQISETTRARFRAASPLAKLIGVAIPVALTALVLAAANTRQGRRMTRQLQETQLPNKALEAWQASQVQEKARKALESARGTLQDPHTRATALQMVDQVRAQMGDLSNRLPMPVQRAPKKRFLFV